MTIEEYHQHFDAIHSGAFTEAPYDKEAYMNYTKLNYARSHRWAKKGVLLPELEEAVLSIATPQKWVLITEPWCGDAANIVPFIEKLAQLNAQVELEIQLRDSGSEIDHYLTNGGKSIPKLIVRDEKGQDLFDWGPRPADAQAIVEKNKTSDKTMDEKYAEVLLWYRDNEGVDTQKELLGLFSKIEVSS